MVIFSLCLSVHTWGVYPSPRFFPRSLGSDPFWGLPQSWLGGGGHTPDLIGAPHPGLGYALSRTRVPPGQDWGTLPWPGLRYPPSPARTRVPPPPSQVPPPPPTGYVADGMPRLVSRRRTFLFDLSLS